MDWPLLDHVVTRHDEADTGHHHDCGHLGSHQPQQVTHAPLGVLLNCVMSGDHSILLIP